MIYRMRFASLNDQLIEAKAALKGFCRGCGQAVVPKCGTVRVHHWSHQGTKMCDDWCETETEWHRFWKNKFPVFCQEFFMPNVINGEKHMADVRTDHGLIIEFQHSHLKPQERIARETFYQNMLWVVDGIKLKYDYPRFIKARSRFECIDPKGIFRVSLSEDCFPRGWVDSRVPVVFDFLGTNSIGIPDQRNTLYCLLPIRIGGSAIVAEITRNAFIKTTTNGEWSERIASLMLKLDQLRQDWENWAEITAFNFRLQELHNRRSNNRPKYEQRRRF